MKKIFTPLMLAAALVFFGCDGAMMETPETHGKSLLSVQSANSGKSLVGGFATDVVSTNQGLRNDGQAVLAARSNPLTMLGAPDGTAEGTYFSLGFSDGSGKGSAVLDFGGSYLLGGLTLSVWEATTKLPVYPREATDVYVSNDPSGPWTYIGTADNMFEITQDPRLSELGPLDLNNPLCMRYVKLQDASNVADFVNEPSPADGFDVDALSLNSLGECPAGGCVETRNLIAGQHNDVGSVIIERLSDTQIKVTFKLDVPGSIKDTYVHVGTSLSDFPLNPKGQPKSGQFDYKTEGHAAGTTEFSYIIDVPEGEPLYVGAHANVAYQWNGSWRSDTSWGEGPRFTNRNWFMYMLFDCE